MTKIVGTLGLRSRSVKFISGCLKAGMSVARFDFSWGDSACHQETLENLRTAVKSTKKLCAVMLDSVGTGMQVVNKSEKAITLKQDDNVILTPDKGHEASDQVLLINFDGLAKVYEYLSKLGDLNQTQIFAKIEMWSQTYFDEILQDADGIILSRGNLGIDLNSSRKGVLFQKAALYKCNMTAKPEVLTRVVDSMTDNLRPTRAEATDVANAVLDGSDKGERHRFAAGCDFPIR